MKEYKDTTKAKFSEALTTSGTFLLELKYQRETTLKAFFPKAPNQEFIKTLIESQKMNWKQVNEEYDVP